MAQIYTDANGTYVIPGATVSYKVQANGGANPATGVLALVGEAASGPDYTTEDITANYFGPNQLPLVRAKYGSGPIVDAFAAAVKPANDPEITGAPSRIYIVKTNQGTKASIALTDLAGSAYGSVTDSSAGARLLTLSVANSVAEVTPAPSSFKLVNSSAGDKTFTIRVNGGSLNTITVADPPVPATVASAIAAISGLSCAEDSGTLTITYNSTELPYDEVKSIEINDDATAILVDPDDGVTSMGWESGVLFKSTTERKIELTATRDGVEEAIAAGTSKAALWIGYQGTTATATVSATALATTVTGGSGSSLNLSFATYKTLKQLADHINGQTGYSASVENASLNNVVPSSLDRGTFGVCSDIASTKPAGIKLDAQKFYDAVANSANVSFATRANKGLPAVTSSVLSAAGTKGPTLAADFSAALDTLKKVKCNFLVPLFSRDSSDDIADDLTDAASTYTIDAVHTLSRSHVNTASSVKRKQNRQAFLAYKGTFSDTKDKALDLASHRCQLVFQDILGVDSQGVSAQFAPHITASLAAGMQAACGYKAIFNKGLNISGVLHSDYEPGDPDVLEDALLNGLLTLERRDTGGFSFVSDQTTYNTDDNFVYNSVQAVYNADTLALLTQTRMQARFTGKTVAEVSAQAALGYLVSILDEARKNLRLIAPSDDAPAGYKDASVTIDSKVMSVRYEAKLNGAIYFIPIEFTISPVRQTASA